ncbi:glycosyltransferase family 1 protein, partial [Longimicrobium sp.]|uniref:glycosyltransferase family 4 protein n=1 Tax=Longimicrobium sp. TaxID=2029185 RepID=UPI002F94C9FB
AGRGAAFAGAKPVRVVFDASILGRGTAQVEFRTGIFRVVQHLVRALAATGACDLALAAPFSPEIAAYTRWYVRSDPVLRHVPMHSAGPGLWLLERLVHAHQSRRGGPGASAATKAYRRVLLHGRKAAAAVLPPRTLRPPDGDVFHSPRYALPEMSVTGRAVRFLTVYDLIPVVVPQFCSQAARDELHTILRSIGSGDWVFTGSESARADLCEYRPDLDPARVVVAYNGADPATFRPVADRARIAEVLRRHGIPDAPYLLSVNAVEPRKNIERAVRAFSRMTSQERLADLRMVLVGNMGQDPHRFFEAAREAGLSPDRLVVTGYVPDEDLAALYSGALAFVYPSLYEGFGLPPLEAMQCGTPVITSNTSSLPEVVGDAGIMVEPTDEDALSQAMLDVCRDGELRRRMQARSLARAARFSWETCARQTIAGYRAGLAGR